MLVCLCHPTSDRDVDQAIDEGATTVAELGERCGAGTGCGACVQELKERLGARACGALSDCPSALTQLRSR